MKALGASLLGGRYYYFGQHFVQAPDPPMSCLQHHWFEPQVTAANNWGLATLPLGLHANEE